MTKDFYSRALLAIALCALTPAQAVAQEEGELIQGEAHRVGPDPGWYVMGGGSGGFTFGSLGPGGFVGGELSIVRLKQKNWVGLYTDALYDFAAASPTLSLGPELGRSFVGVDGGVSVRFDDEATRLGAQARLLLTAGIFSLYGRYGIWPGDSLEHTIQLGVLLKGPVFAW